MVRLRPLEPRIGVRVPVSQPSALPPPTFARLSNNDPAQPVSLMSVVAGKRQRDLW